MKTSVIKLFIFQILFCLKLSAIEPSDVLRDFGFPLIEEKDASNLILYPFIQEIVIKNYYDENGKFSRSTCPLHQIRIWFLMNYIRAFEHGEEFKALLSLYKDKPEELTAISKYFSKYFSGASDLITTRIGCIYATRKQEIIFLKSALQIGFCIFLKSEMENMQRQPSAPRPKYDRTWKNLDRMVKRLEYIEIY